MGHPPCPGSGFGKTCAIGVLAALALTLVTTGCGGGGAASSSSSRSESALAEEGSAVFAPAGRAPSGSAQAADARWSIVLASVPVEDAQRARELLQQVRTTGQLPEAQLEPRGKVAAITYGSYTGPDDPAAARDLERLRALVVDGARPYVGALLSPPAFENLKGSIPEYDLTNVRAARGPSAKYTLEIGVYTRTDGRQPSESDLREIRRAAEQAAIALRREGEEAFYYHGPSTSSVTVGVFAPSEYEIPTRERATVVNAIPRAGPRVILLREKYPQLLINGAGGKVGRKGSGTKLTESRLVEIP